MEITTAHKTGDFEDGSPEWLAQRELGIGGSDIASVAGIPGAFTSRYVLWMQKAGYIEREEPSEDKAELFFWGHALEPVVAKAFEQRTGYHVGAAGSWAHNEHEWAQANPDGLLYDGKGELVSGLEIKNSGMGYGFEDGPPAKYVAQARWYAGILGMDDWWLAVLVSGRELRIWQLVFKPHGTECFQLERDNSPGDVRFYDITFSGLMTEAHRFRAALEAGIPPPITGDVDVYAHFQKAVEGIDPDAEVEISLELAQRLHQWDASAKEADAELRRAKSEVLSAMNGAKHAVHDGTRAAYVQQSGRATKPSLYLAKGGAAKAKFLAATTS